MLSTFSDVLDMFSCAGWGPYAYFRMLEESRLMTQVPNVPNSGHAQLTEVQAESEQGQGPHGCMGLSLSRDRNAILDDTLNLEGDKVCTSNDLALCKLDACSYPRI